MDKIVEEQSCEAEWLNKGKCPLHGERLMPIKRWWEWLKELIVIKTVDVFWGITKRVFPFLF